MRKVNFTATALLLSLVSTTTLAGVVNLRDSTCNGTWNKYNNSGFTDLTFTSHTNSNCAVGAGNESKGNCYRNELKMNVPFKQNSIHYSFDLNIKDHPFEGYNIFWQMLPRMSPKGSYPVFTLSIDKEGDKYKLMQTTNIYNKDAKTATDRIQVIDTLIEDFHLNNTYKLNVAVYPSKNSNGNPIVDSNGNPLGYLKVVVEDNINNKIVNYWSENGRPILLHNNKTAHSGHEELMFIGIGQYWANYVPAIPSMGPHQQFRTEIDNISLATPNLNTGTYEWHTFNYLDRICGDVD